MGRLNKIDITKGERRITINALDVDKYIAQGWTAKTEPYINKPATIANIDKPEAPEAPEAPDNDLLVD